MAKEEFSHVSSSLLRQIAALGGDLSKFLPEPVKAALIEQAREGRQGCAPVQSDCRSSFCRLGLPRHSSAAVRAVRKPSIAVVLVVCRGLPYLAGRLGVAPAQTRFDPSARPQACRASRHVRRYMPSGSAPGGHVDCRGRSTRRVGGLERRAGHPREAGATSRRAARRAYEPVVLPGTVAARSLLLRDQFQRHELPLPADVQQPVAQHRRRPARVRPAPAPRTSTPPRTSPGSP